MIRHLSVIAGHNWNVYALLDADADDADELLTILSEEGCRGGDLISASNFLHSGKRNIGLTFSNVRARESVLIIGRTTSAEEYINSLFHETYHVAQHIAREDGINPLGEVICYIAGELARDLFVHSQNLTCDCCRARV